jgi:hypothetical protein
MGRLNDLANKWGTDKGDGNYDKHDYANAYEELIDLIPAKDRKFKLLEIGIWDPRNPGASIRMWREFLGEAEIHGVDINEGCKILEDECKITVHIADQGDVSSLKMVMDKIGEVDFIVDDGSHILMHQMNTFDVMWPHVTKGGFYAIEDLQAPQSQPRDALVPFGEERGATNHMWLSPKLLVFKKE